MDFLTNVQSSIEQMRFIIQSDPEIRKLLYHDFPEALESEVDVSFEDVNGRVEHLGIFDVTKPPFNKNTFITLTLTNSFADENFWTNLIRINILTRSELWPLKKSKIRTLEIARRILLILNSKKLSTSQIPFASSLEFMVVNDNIQGYYIIFDLIEGDALDDNF